MCFSLCTTDQMMPMATHVLYRFDKFLLYTSGKCFGAGAELLGSQQVHRQAEAH